MPYLEVPIIGSGEPRTARNPQGDSYRGAVTVGKSCVIPSNPDGSPKFTTAIVWVPDKYETEIPRAIPRIPLAQGRQLARQMDPSANLDRLEQKR